MLNNNERNPAYGGDDVEAVDTTANKNPLVSVVILNWNGIKFLEKFLPSVLSCTYTNKKIIVADNASTDNSVIFLQENFPEVEIIINASNEGFAKGYNTALKQVQSDYYVLLNSDVEVTPGWIEPVIDLMENDKAIAACQPKILAYNNKNMFEYAGASGGWIDKFGYPFCRGRIFEICEEDNGQYDDVQECFWASGAALFVRAPVYHQVGGLDEYFFAHQEEIDFCWRLQLAGYKVYVQPHSAVYHVGGGTLPKGDNRKTVLNFRNNLIMLTKNLPVGMALWKIPYRLWLDAVSAYWALFTKGDGGFFLAIIKSHVKYTGWFFFKQKKSVFPVKRGIVKGGWYTGSVVWEYFIKKKNTFLEIIKNK
ncbi:MAG: glycosyltransferase family 2 protein [Chitinophagaceae bacterium]|nr:glycosyltransferase family 2 protein [Chitinophagaceae bacterium]